MRFAGMRSAAYADPAPGHLGVLNALSKEEDASGDQLSLTLLIFASSKIACSGQSG